jgi:hypothetical protein
MLAPVTLDRMIGVVLMLLAASGCSRKSANATLDAAPAPVAASASAAGGASSEPGSDELKPVYPVDAGPPDPLAARLCDALHAVPAKRLAACTSKPAGPAPAIVQGQCVRTLTAALAAHAVKVDPGDVDRCNDAMTRATSGCDWAAGAGLSPLPAECDGVVHGALAAGASCRSSLECPDGSRCQGLSTIDTGTCAAPKAAGLPCNLADDMLATFARQDHYDRAHPECAGTCVGRMCRPAAPLRK